MTSGNDVFRNNISIWWVRVILVVNIPAVIVAAKNLDILGQLLFGSNCTVN